MTVHEAANIVAYFLGFVSGFGIAVVFCMEWWDKRIDKRDKRIAELEEYLKQLKFDDEWEANDDSNSD